MNLLKDGVAVLGGFAGHESSLEERSLAQNEPTILSGDLENDDLAVEAVRSVEDTMIGTNTEEVVAAIGVGRTAVLDGVTITGGMNRDGDGGGMRIYGASPTINACRFVRNFANEGGGISLERSTPLISNCLFFQNEADESGGAISCVFARPLITHCTFVDNLNDIDSNDVLVARTWSYLTLTNSIVWNREDEGGLPLWTEVESFQFCSHNLLQNSDEWDDTRGTDWGGNLPDPPRFILGTSRVRVDSPARGHGLPIFVPEDRADFDEDGDLGERLSRDLHGTLFEPPPFQGRVTAGCFQYRWSEDSDADGFTDFLEAQVTGDALGLETPTISLSLARRGEGFLVVRSHRNFGDFFELQLEFTQSLAAPDWRATSPEKIRSALRGDNLVRTYRIDENSPRGFYHVRFREK